MKIFNNFLESNFKFTYYNNNIEITNYIDIPLISDIKIIVTNKDYVLNIIGINLSILKLNKDQLLIKGDIKNIGIEKNE